MASTALTNLLAGLNLLENRAVFFYNKKDGACYDFPSREIEKKLSIIKPTAFYVFNNQPYILFFDLTNEEVRARENELHKQVWSFDQCPLIFLVDYNSIKIFNAFSYNKTIDRLEEVLLKEDESVKEIFSFWNLQSGATWNWLQERYYKDSIQRKRVNQKLFENIKLVRESLTHQLSDTPLTDDDANILVLRLIFIRYLIDRDIKINAEFVSGISVSDKRKSFSLLIEDSKKLNDFFQVLNEKFNGVLFKNAESHISDVQAKSLSLIFKGEKPEEGSLFEGTDFYFDVFDFSIIPVEVISGIYESLIDEQTRKLQSAVYTPSFLVEYILSQTIDNYFKKPQNAQASECKVFDPSVGSGIFLVQAFRRMVDQELSIHPKEKITRVRLREIAQNNLFGIDVNLQALKVACFSIYIAILDYQEPKTILGNFHFPKLLNENLFEADFFNTEHTYNDIFKKIKFDFLLGNPPWKSNKNDFHTTWLKNTGNVVGRYEIAQSFLLRAEAFMNADTISALVVTSTIFFNVSNTTRNFKYKFLTKYCLLNFLDLSPVRRLIFEEKNSPCAIVLFNLSDGENHNSNEVLHQSVKYNMYIKYYKTLVLEKFDQKKIKQEYFISNDWMFKVALYGNTLDFLLIEKLQTNGLKILDLIDNKKVFAGAGVKTNKGNLPSEFLVGLPILENGEVEQYYTPIKEEAKKLKIEDVYFERGRTKNLFYGNKILLKEQAKNESEIVVSIVTEDAVYKNGIWGIASTNEDIIKLLLPFLISELYSYYIFITSCSWGVSTRPQIRFEEEFLSFPYITPDEATKERLLSLVEQFMSPIREHYNGFALGEPIHDKDLLKDINQQIFALYEINSYEKDLVDYALSISRYQFQESKQNKILRRVDTDYSLLEKYAETIRKDFEDIYTGEYVHVDIFPLHHFIAMNFTFKKNKPHNKINIISQGSTKEVDILKKITHSASISEISKHLYVQKDIKGFEENSFYIIKPNEFKSWHHALVWYDLAELKEVIQSIELKRLGN